MISNSKRFLNGKISASSFIAMLAIYMFLSELGQAILGLFVSVKSAVYVLVCGTFPPISMFLTILIVKLVIKQPFGYITSFSKFNPKHIVSALLLSVGMFLGLGWVNISISMLFEKIGVNSSSITLPLNNGLQFVLSCVVFALLPAVAEEFFFRGVMQNGLKGSGIFASSLMVGLFFALYHLSVQQLLYQFIFGVMMCVIVSVSKSVIPSVISHFINNFVIILLTYFGVEVNFFNPLLIALGLCSLCAFIMLCVTDKNFKKARAVTTSGGVRSFLIPSGILSIAFCVLMIIVLAVV